MRKMTGLLAALMVLAACEERPDLPADNFPPVGLASTAVWLENKQSLTAAARTGAAQARAANVPDARLQTVSAPAQRTVPERTRPAGDVARAAQAFADICVASVNDPDGLTARMRQVNQRDFGVEPREFSGRRPGVLSIGGDPRGPIQVETARNVGRNGITQCVVSVRGSDKSATAQAMIDALVAQGLALQPIAARRNAQQSWSIRGAAAGTTLNLGSRRNSVGVWIAWP